MSYFPYCYIVNDLPDVSFLTLGVGCSSMTSMFWGGPQALRFAEVSQRHLRRLGSLYGLCPPRGLSNRKLSQVKKRTKPDEPLVGANDFFVVFFVGIFALLRW